MDYARYNMYARVYHSQLGSSRLMHFASALSPTTTPKKFRMSIKGLACEKVLCLKV